MAWARSSSIWRTTLLLHRGCRRDRMWGFQHFVAVATFYRRYESRQRQKVTIKGKSVNWEPNQYLQSVFQSTGNCQLWLVPVHDSNYCNSISNNNTERFPCFVHSQLFQLPLAPHAIVPVRSGLAKWLLIQRHKPTHYQINRATGQQHCTRSAAAVSITNTMRE